MNGGVNEEFLRTLLASNAIWAAVTVTLTGIGGVIAFVWRRRSRRAAEDAEAELCQHCFKCHGALGLVAESGDFADLGREHVVTHKLCHACIQAAHGKRDSARAMP